MPWHMSGRFAFSPINVGSKKPYRGINTVCLWAAAQAKGYERGEWGTYQQWLDKGAQVRKGEKSTTVVFWKFAHESAETQDDGAEAPAGRSKLLFMRGYSVFNAAQVDGYTPKVDAEATIAERITHADVFFRAIGADVRNGEIRRTMCRSRTTSRCRRSKPSLKQWPTMRRSRMNTRTGRRRLNVATVSSVSGLVITHTPPKS